MGKNFVVWLLRCLWHATEDMALEDLGYVEVDRMAVTVTLHLTLSMTSLYNRSSPTTYAHLEKFTEKVPHKKYYTIWQCKS